MQCDRAALAACLLTMITAAAGAAEPDAQRREALIHLLRHDCGSCHGMTLGGGLGPALTPAALEGKSVASLTATILHGRPGTPMPPWRGLLDDDEARWLAKAMKTGNAR